MRILNLVAGEKWTGTAAVVHDQTAALVAAGVEAQFAFVRASLLATRLQNVGWGRPLFEPAPRWPAAYLRDWSRLRDTLKREPFDVVHAHASHDHWIAAMAIDGKGKPRLARTIHHLRHARPGSWSVRLYARTAAFAFANQSIARASGRDGPVHSPVVDVERFRPGPGNPDVDVDVFQRFGLPRGRFLVGTIGKMAPGRGHEEALDAIARLPESAVGVHVGHGEWVRRLQARADALGAGARNFWLGYQEEPLPDLYRSWDAFLFTASGSEQGQRAILEAMASGLPVVALALPGVEDLLTDGREGFVVERPEDLADRLTRLASSEDLRRGMARRARERALAFTAAAFARTAVEFYEGVAAGG